MTAAADTDGGQEDTIATSSALPPPPAAGAASRSMDSLELLIREADELRAKLDAERSKLQDVPSELPGSD